MIKFIILFLLIIYIAFRFSGMILKYFLKRVLQNRANPQENTQKRKESTHHSKSSSSTNSAKKGNQSLGEYVEYEEI